jgi:hypothetical protein
MLKMETSPQAKLMAMMSNDLLYMSNQLMKAKVERDEALSRYQKLLTSFAHLLEKAIYYRSELGLPNDLGNGELWDYTICEEAGILDTGEITSPQGKQDH